MNEKDKSISEAMASIENRLRHVYNQGFKDGMNKGRKTSKWRYQSDRSKPMYGWYFCNECGAYLGDTDGANYCSWCGAKMEVDE